MSSDAHFLNFLKLFGLLTKEDLPLKKEEDDDDF
jgi:hypothetical protein